VALVAALCGIGVVACENSVNPVDETASAPLFAPGGNQNTSCDFRNLKSDARDYFSNPESQDAQDLIKLMEDACGTDQAAVTAEGWQLLSLVETTLYQGAGGDAADGDAVVNGALAFMFPCAAGAAGCTVPSGDFTVALDPDASANGAFGVRALEANDTTPVFSRGTPTWAAEPGQTGGPDSPSLTWQVSLPDASQPALLYGKPKSSTSFPINDTQLSDTYEWNIIPRPANGFDEQLVIGVCINPGPLSGETPRVQRNATALQVGITSACEIDDFDAVYPFAATPSTMDLLAEGAGAVLASLAPQPLFASLVVKGGGGVGGQVNNFSDFTLVGADTDAELVFVTGPTDVSTNGSGIATLGTIQVLAQTGSGTPIEFINVTLIAKDNNGATVVFGGDTSKLTVENGGVATFDDLTLNKTGGYQICATAADASFSFAGEYCSARFNVRPN